MSYALDRAAAYLSEDLKKYKIEVPKGNRVFIRRGMAVAVDPFTTYRKCLSILRAAIREEKRLAEVEQMKNQGSLFE